MSALVLTTVGTTALTNTYINQVNATLQRWAKAKDETFRRDSKCEADLSEVLIKNAKIPGVSRAAISAELASLDLILKRFQIEPDDGSRFVFFCSETHKGMAAGRINALAFRRLYARCTGCLVEDGKCLHVDIKIIHGLDPQSATDFVKGVQRLYSAIQNERRTFSPPAGRQRHFIFNITGAYKGIIPWATEACKRHRYTMAYLYENADSLILKQPDQEEPLPE